MGTQKNCLNEMILLNTQNMLKHWIRKYSHFTLNFYSFSRLMNRIVFVWIISGYYQLIERPGFNNQPPPPEDQEEEEVRVAIVHSSFLHPYNLA